MKRARQRSVMIGNHMKSPLFEDDENASEQRKQLRKERREILSDCNNLSKETMGFCDLLKPRMAFAALFTSCISMYCVSFYSAFLAVQLEEVYGVPESQMGYCFLLASGPYLIACIILPAILKNVPRRLQMVICFLVSSISIGLMGPSRLFVVVPDTLPVILIGMFFLGFIQPLSFIPCLPEVID